MKLIDNKKFLSLIDLPFDQAEFEDTVDDVMLDLQTNPASYDYTSKQRNELLSVFNTNRQKIYDLLLNQFYAKYTVEGNPAYQKLINIAKSFYNQYKLRYGENGSKSVFDWFLNAKNSVYNLTVTDTVLNKSLEEIHKMFVNLWKQYKDEANYMFDNHFYPFTKRFDKLTFESITGKTKKLPIYLGDMKLFASYEDFQHEPEAFRIIFNETFQYQFMYITDYTPNSYIEFEIQDIDDENNTITVDFTFYKGKWKAEEDDWACLEDIVNEYFSPKQVNILMRRI